MYPPDHSIAAHDRRIARLRRFGAWWNLGILPLLYGVLVFLSLRIFDPYTNDDAGTILVSLLLPTALTIAISFLALNWFERWNSRKLDKDLDSAD